MKERVDYLDMARGVAMICIVMLHLTIFNLRGDASQSVGSFCHYFDTRLLFFLSGMTAAISVGSKGSTIRECMKIGLKKLRTLFMPFMVWSVIVMPYIFNRSDVNQFMDLVQSSFDPQKGGYWFLLYLFVFQLLLIGIRFVSSKLFTVFPNELWRELMVVFVASWLLFPVYEYFFIFTVGYFVQKYGQHFFYNKVYTCVALVLFVVLYAYAGSVRDNSIVRVIMALSACSVILAVLRNDSKPIPGGGIFKYLGRNSLEIYLLHFCLVAVTRDYLIATDKIYAVPLFFLLGGLAVLICWLCCKIAELMKRVPYVAFVLFGNR